MTVTRSALSTLQSALMQQSFIEKLTSQLQQASQEVSTGLKADIYGDLGGQAVQSLTLQGQLDRTNAFISANKFLATKLDAISTATTQVQGLAQSMMTQMIGNADTPAVGASTLQVQARAALDQITSALNVSLGGEYLFSGTSSDRPPLQAYSDTNASTGSSPQDVVSGIVGSGPTSAADVASMVGALNAVFNSANSGTPAANYEGTFYNGTPAADAGGTANPRQTAQVGAGQTLSYGVQANDPAFRQVIQGLTMIASTDVSKITDPAAYKAWMSAAIGTLSGGMAGITQAQVAIGSQQNEVNSFVTKQGDMTTVYNNAIVTLTGVDSYEAASRFSALQTQLNASYSATAQMQKLSILNYL